MELAIVAAVICSGLLYVWRVEVQGLAAFALRHPFHRHSSAGREAATSTQSAPPLCTVYTAGACDQDAGPGGWAYVPVGAGAAQEDSGEHPHTTATRMELTAAIKALEATAPGSMVLVHTGSQLVQQGMAGWVHKWRQSDWCTGAGQPIENQDLWEQLWRLDAERRVRWEWTEATEGRPQQERVHALADAARRRAAARATGAPADSRGAMAAEDGGPNLTPEQEMEARMQDTTPAEQPSPNDRRQALMAECRALERRWVELHEEALHLDQEWQHLLTIISSRVEGSRNGQLPSWTDGAALFYDLDKHAARTSGLAREALQTCRQYAGTLRQAMDDMAEGPTGDLRG